MRTEEAIRNRRTHKMKGDAGNPLPITKGKEFRQTMEELIALAGRAPFHYTSEENLRSKELEGAEPWRFHALECTTCRSLLKDFNEDRPIKCSDGIKQMLAVADGLILTTWLPEGSSKLDRKYYPNIKNMEHIAATGAAIQNLLLAATSRGIANYWSSGGCFRKPKMMQYLGIPEHEILLGALFLFPETDREDVIVKPGKNTDQRGAPSAWANWIKK
ncbi:nitroreductase family protein [Gracilimonas mengyeensis]|uniref:Nitroreductase n=1 Tax=Gracilimonas mengyeensis TaxID=1302730 RepID=A0A521CNF2_9BACT|nr:nitroreductase family protein [Gracilimonas mengyeensis]SMO60972.1 Nitroreductase [Gracilimonas mengyeensis]